MSVPALASTGAVDAPRRDRRWPPTIPLAIVSILIVCALGAPVLAPRSPVEGSLGERLIPPMGMEGWKAGHPLGTDGLGHDELSLLVYGARVSMTTGVIVILAAGGLGSLLGIMAGYYGGWRDAVIMRLVDTSFAFPGSCSLR